MRDDQVLLRRVDDDALYAFRVTFKASLCCQECRLQFCLLLLHLPHLSAPSPQFSTSSLSSPDGTELARLFQKNGFGMLRGELMAAVRCSLGSAVQDLAMHEAGGESLASALKRFNKGRALLVMLGLSL